MGAIGARLVWGGEDVGSWLASLIPYQSGRANQGRGWQGEGPQEVGRWALISPFGHCSAQYNDQSFWYSSHSVVLVAWFIYIYRLSNCNVNMPFQYTQNIPLNFPAKTMTNNLPKNLVTELKIYALLYSRKQTLQNTWILFIFSAP